jgi:hypothetical protein
MHKTFSLSTKKIKSLLFFGVATLSPCVCNAKDFLTKVVEIITF